MIYHAGVEDIEPNHWVAFVFDHPGCFSSARTQDEAIANAPTCIVGYFEWLASYDCAMPTPSGPIEVQVAEVFHSFLSESNPDYIVNALFEDDRKPLTSADIAIGLIILDYSRSDLSTVVDKIPPTQFDQPLANDSKNSIAKILDHIAWAEWWYFNRLDIGFPRSEMPQGTRAKLDEVRDQTRALLRDLGGDSRITVRAGEKWSVRKVLRRTLWHERDHTRQIGEIVNLAKV